MLTPICELFLAHHESDVKKKRLEIDSEQVKNRFYKVTAKIKMTLL